MEERIVQLTGVLEGLVKGMANGSTAMTGTACYAACIRTTCTGGVGVGGWGWWGGGAPDATAPRPVPACRPPPSRRLRTAPAILPRAAVHDLRHPTRRRVLRGLPQPGTPELSWRPPTKELHEKTQAKCCSMGIPLRPEPCHAMP